MSMGAMTISCTSAFSHAKGEKYPQVLWGNRLTRATGCAPRGREEAWDPPRPARPPTAPPAGAERGLLPKHPPSIHSFHFLLPTPSTFLCTSFSLLYIIFLSIQCIAHMVDAQPRNSYLYPIWNIMVGWGADVPAHSNLHENYKYPSDKLNK